jgi:hypothetical protein
LTDKSEPEPFTLRPGVQKRNEIGNIADVDALRAPSGGNTIRIHGSNLGAASAVVFGVDPATGAGGTPASSLVVIDPGTLEIVAPAHALGPQNLLVRDDATGQAALLPAAYSFTLDSSSGGGGGCYVLPHTPPAGPRELLAGAWWLFALLVALHLRAWHRATSSPSTSR